MNQLKRLQGRGRGSVTLYNVIFPVWFLLFFPPVILLTLVGNFIIDLAVLWSCYSVYKLKAFVGLKDFLAKGIWKVWIFGFLADMIGAAFLFLSDTVVPYEWVRGISFDPFSNVGSILTILFAMLISSVLIFLLNYKVSFHKLISDQALRLKSALFVAIVTVPWTFLLPTKWFYHGF